MIKITSVQYRPERLQHIHFCKMHAMLMSSEHHVK